jgi:hypothetical protein
MEKSNEAIYGKNRGQDEITTFLLRSASEQKLDEKAVRN